MSDIITREPRKKIGFGVKLRRYAEGEQLGKRAVYFRSNKNRNSISSLYPYCRKRNKSIGSTIDSLTIQDNVNEVDSKLISLSSKKKINSVIPTGIDTYILKGVSIPAKQAVTSIVSQTASMVATMSSFVTSSLSSFLGFSINMALTFKDLKKYGGSPSYVSYIYCFYVLQFLCLVATAFFAWITLGAKFITPLVLGVVALFFIINLIVGYVFKIYDRHIANKIDEKAAENLYLTIRKKILEENN